VYYFLGEYDEALSFALGAGNAFEAESRAFGAEEYVETVVCEWYLVALFVRKLKKWVA
jgi:demethoxyubiquinone hydroxylase (CLK1/Coq7/Cat5 family)